MRNMTFFRITARNPIVRAGIIRMLLKLGYVLPMNCTISSFHKGFPASRWPCVIFAQLHEPTFLQGTMDLSLEKVLPDYTSGQTIKNFSLSKKSLAEIPRADNVTHNTAHIEQEPPISNKAANKPSGFNPSFVLPPASKYNITYTKKDGSVEQYTISNPLEVNEVNFTAYAFGKGVRSFNKDRVLSFAKAE